jgi:hypothetical protein
VRTAIALAFGRSLAVIQNAVPLSRRRRSHCIARFETFFDIAMPQRHLSHRRHRVIEPGTLINAAALGLSTGFLYAVHNRSLGAIAVILLLLICLVHRAQLSGRGCHGTLIRGAVICLRAVYPLPGLRRPPGM